MCWGKHDIDDENRQNGIFFCSSLKCILKKRVNVYSDATAPLDWLIFECWWLESTPSGSRFWQTAKAATVIMHHGQGLSPSNTHTHTLQMFSANTAFSANTEHQARGKDPEIPTKDIKLDLFSKLNQIDPVGISDVDGNSGRKVCKCCDCCRDAHWPTEVGCLVECLTCYYWAWSSILSIQLSIYLWQKQGEIKRQPWQHVKLWEAEVSRVEEGWDLWGFGANLRTLWCKTSPQQQTVPMATASCQSSLLTNDSSALLSSRPATCVFVSVCLCVCMLFGRSSQAETHTYIWPIWNLLKNSFARNKTDIEKSLTAKILEMNKS